MPRPKSSLNKDLLFGVSPWQTNTSEKTVHEAGPGLPPHEIHFMAVPDPVRVDAGRASSTSAKRAHAALAAASSTPWIRSGMPSLDTAVSSQDAEGHVTLVTDSRDAQSLEPSRDDLATTIDPPAGLLKGKKG